MEPDLHKRYYFINHYNNKHSSFCRQSSNIADSEDNYRGEYLHYKTAKNFGIEMSPEKSELMAFLGQDPVLCKIIVDNKCL